MEVGVCLSAPRTHERRGRRDRTAPSASISSIAAGSKARNAAYWADAGAIEHIDKSETSSVEDLSNWVPPFRLKYT